MRIDDPNISLLEDTQQVLILDKLKHHNDVSKRLVQSDPLHYLSLVRKDTNILQRRIIFPQSQNLCLIRSDSYLSTERCNSDKHVFMTESIEPLSKGVLREGVTLIAILRVLEVVPIVVHNI